jgi:hypothetical protein
MEVNPLLKYDTSVPAKYYTGTVESQERIKGFWSFGALGGREALKHRGTESTEKREERQEGKTRWPKNRVLVVPF